MTIQTLPEWTTCCQVANWPRQRNEAEKIFKSASSDQLVELIAIVESGEPTDQHVALSVLEHFARAKYDVRWTRDRRDHLVHALRRHVVENYPQGLARHAAQILHQMDFSWLEEFLGSFPMERVPESGRFGFIYDLSNLGSKQARLQLERIAETDWDAAYRARDAAKRTLRDPPAVDERDYNPPTRLAGPLVGTPEWKALLKSQNPFLEIAAWLHLLSDRDIVDLATTWEQGIPDERRCAGAVLRAAARKNDPRLASESERILKRAEILALQLFEELGLLPSEYHLIRDFSQDRAIDFLFARLNQKNLSERHQMSLFRGMAELGGPRIVSRMQELAAQRGPLSEAATGYLEEKAPLTPEKIATMATRWRQKHNAKDLSWLYFRYIEHTKQGSSVEHIVQLLGEPSEKGERFYCWKSKAPPIRLYLETDTDGTLGWMKLYDD